jgi:hypothetical protein
MQWIPERISRMPIGNDLRRPFDLNGGEMRNQ